MGGRCHGGESICIELPIQGGSLEDSSGSQDSRTQPAPLILQMRTLRLEDFGEMTYLKVQGNLETRVVLFPLHHAFQEPTRVGRVGVPPALSAHADGAIPAITNSR